MPQAYLALPESSRGAVRAEVQARLAEFESNGRLVMTVGMLIGVGSIHLRPFPVASNRKHSTLVEVAMQRRHFTEMPPRPSFHGTCAKSREAGEVGGSASGDKRERPA